MTKIDIAVGYDVWGSTRVELPDDRQWQDVKSLYVMWSTAYITFKDGDQWEADLEDASEGVENCKRPYALRIFNMGAVDDDDVAYCDGDVLHDGENDYKAADIKDTVGK
jgi:hypothetical protein